MATQSVIESIRTPGDYSDTLLALMASVLDETGNNTRKQQSQHLLQAISNIICDPQAQILTKFFAVMVAKDISLKNYPNFLSVLANSQLLTEMSKLCRLIDPDKKQKGRAFCQDQLIGGKFMALVSECLTVWAEKYPLTSQKTPSKFKSVYAELIADGVVMPREFLYFQSIERRDSIPNYIAEEKSPGNAQPGYVQQTEYAQPIQFTPQQPPPPLDYAQVQQMRRSQHQYVQQHHQHPSQVMPNAVAENFSTINKAIGYESEDTIINDPIITEQKIQRPQIKINPEELEAIGLSPTGRPIANSEPVLSTSMRYQAMNPNQYANPEVQQHVYQQINHQKAPTPPQKHSPQVTPLPTPVAPPPINSIGYMPPPTSKAQNFASTVDFNSNSIRPGLDFNSQGKQTLFNTLNTNDAAHELHNDGLDRFLSAKPSVGFNSVRMELENQKNKGPGSSRQKIPPSPDASHLQKFASMTINEPTLVIANPIISKNDYEGEIVKQDGTYTESLKRMSSGQSLDRFKKCLVKNKNILYEDSHVQVGYKSEFVIDADSHPFQIFLNFILFFGNKTQQPITNFKVKYRGDKTNLLYCNPPQSASQIPPNGQIKQDLMVVPTQIPCTLLTCLMTFSHPTFTSTMSTQCLLPNTMLKLTKLNPLEPSVFASSQGRIFRTTIFKLCKTFQPVSIKKYLPQLVEFTPYEAFIKQQVPEYVLGCAGQILQSDEFLLKVTVRGDMSCVLQLATLDCEGDDSEQAEKNVKAFVRALHMALGDA